MPSAIGSWSGLPWTLLKGFSSRQTGINKDKIYQTKPFVKRYFRVYYGFYRLRPMDAARRSKPEKTGDYRMALNLLENIYNLCYVKNNNLRDIAIIAHVDHGKTTLVDAMFCQSGVVDTILAV